MKASEVENGVQRGEEIRRFWDEVCAAGREDERDKRCKGGGQELGRDARERLRVVVFDGRCESPACVWGLERGEGKEDMRGIMEVLLRLGC